MHRRRSNWTPPRPSRFVRHGVGQEFPSASTVPIGGGCVAPVRASATSTIGAATTLCMVAMSLELLVFGTIVDTAGYRLAWAELILPSIQHD